ncbi:MAG: hypothetical protein OQL28_12120, partial [Sedimenticola sp.]|nr:hypothetical protein [Sedimenticola sp.]
EGLASFFRPAALSVAHLESLNFAPFALLDKKMMPATIIKLVLTGPRSGVMAGNKKAPPQQRRGFSLQRGTKTYDLKLKLA